MPPWAQEKWPQLAAGVLRWHAASEFPFSLDGTEAKVQRHGAEPEDPAQAPFFLAVQRIVKRVAPGVEELTPTHKVVQRVCRLPACFHSKLT
jgi:hypothetical protein